MALLGPREPVLPAALDRLGPVRLGKADLAAGGVQHCRDDLVHQQLLGQRVARAQQQITLLLN